MKIFASLAAAWTNAAGAAETSTLGQSGRISFKGGQGQQYWSPPEDLWVAEGVTARSFRQKWQAWIQLSHQLIACPGSPTECPVQLEGRNVTFVFRCPGRVILFDVPCRRAPNASFASVTSLATAAVMARARPAPPVRPRPRAPAASRNRRVRHHP